MGAPLFKRLNKGDVPADVLTAEMFNTMFDYIERHERLENLRTCAPLMKRGQNLVYKKTPVTASGGGSNDHPFKVFNAGMSDDDPPVPQVRILAGTVTTNIPGPVKYEGSNVFVEVTVPVPQTSYIIIQPTWSGTSPWPTQNAIVVHDALTTLPRDCYQVAYVELNAGATAIESIAQYATSSLGVIGPFTAELNPTWWRK